MNATLTTIQPKYHTAHFIGEGVPRTQDTDQFESIQRREARVPKTEEGQLFSGCVAALLSQFELQPLQDRGKQQRLMFLHKMVRVHF